MPVLPLVGSSSSRPGSSSPAASAAWIIVFAIRSLVEPVGFWPSSFAYSRMPGGASRVNSTSGVRPTRSRTPGWASPLAPTGHRREQDNRGAVRDRRLQAVEGAHVLALDVDVHERSERVAREDLVAKGRKAVDQIVEEVTDGLAFSLDLALAAGLRAQSGGDADDRHACAAVP